MRPSGVPGALSISATLSPSRSLRRARRSSTRRRSSGVPLKGTITSTLGRSTSRPRPRPQGREDLPLGRVECLPHAVVHVYVDVVGQPPREDRPRNLLPDEGLV